MDNSLQDVAAAEDMATIDAHPADGGEVAFDPNLVAETERVKGILAAHAAKPLSDFLANKIKEASKNWDSFYKRNTTNFFKDRHWTTKEFAELNKGDGRKVLLEVACDFSKKAIEFVQSHESYDEARCKGFVCDLTKDPLVDTIEKDSVDIVSAIFCLSAIPPEKLEDAVKNIASCIKPGGLLIMRDYGIMDQAELRFKPGRMIRPHFYARQDGTFSVYFSIEQLHELFEKAGFEVEEAKYVTKEIENRKLELVMERHDAQLDYYGKRLATCSSDRTIRIFDVEPDGHKLISVLEGHEGPVWQVAWAHPKFGNILASCSYDTRVFIWKEVDGQWVKAKDHVFHSSSVNSIAWAPHENGLILACASSDGKISILTYREDGSWDATSVNAHSIGVNAVSWAPSTVPGSLITMSGGANPASMKRFVSAGCDNLIKIWREENGTWKEEGALDGHTDWVRDVSWAPSVGLPTSYIASCSQENNSGPWTKKLLQKEPFPDVVWRVSWSTSGNILAVSCGDNKITLWKENLDGEYGQIGDVSEST
ncbi:GTPase-activating protein S13 [Dinochytrium kinnereticum]|nr:GTPase-activating protein S13 [Dinochytrium kinnereticum]